MNENIKSNTSDTSDTEKDKVEENIKKENIPENDDPKESKDSKESDNSKNTKKDEEKDAKPSIIQKLKNSGLKKENDKLKDENKKLEGEIDAVKERLLRVSAEYENFRKRTQKEKENIYNDACEDVLKNMLPVIDNLESASKVQGSIDDIKKGIDMTLRQFNDSLSKLNVEEIPTDGEFDPNLHNAVMHVEDEKYGKNQIVEVLRKGYRRENKVIRYSMVKVAN